MNDPIEVTITNNEDFLGYVTALQRIQAIQQDYIRWQVEMYGRPQDEMSEAKAEIDERRGTP